MVPPARAHMLRQQGRLGRRLRDGRRLLHRLGALRSRVVVVRAARHATTHIAQSAPQHVGPLLLM